MSQCVSRNVTDMCHSVTESHINMSTFLKLRINFAEGGLFNFFEISKISHFGFIIQQLLCVWNNNKIISTTREINLRTKS